MKNLKTPWAVGINPLTVVDASGLVILNGTNLHTVQHVVQLVNDTARLEEAHARVNAEVANRLEPGAVVDVPGYGDCRLVAQLPSGYPRNADCVEGRNCEMWEVRPLMNNLGGASTTALVPTHRKVGAS